MMAVATPATSTSPSSSGRTRRAPSGSARPLHRAPSGARVARYTRSGPTGRARIRAVPRNQVAATPQIPHSTAVSSRPSIVGAGPVGCSPPPTCRLGHRHDPPPCDPTLPAWQAPPGWCRLTSFGSCGRLASHLERRHGPYHPMRVTTAHPGWAHAGRHRAGWAKGARGWRTPSGSRTPPRPAALATCWSTTSKRSPTAWGRDAITVVAAPSEVAGGYRRLPAVPVTCVDRRPHQQRRSS